MEKKEIIIGNRKFPYQNEVIVTTQSGSEYSILILSNHYLGEFLVKKLTSEDDAYNYLLGIGSLKIIAPRKLLNSLFKSLNKTKKEILFYKNKITVNKNTLDLKSFIDGNIFYEKIANSYDLRKLRNIRNTLLRSSKENSFSRTFMTSLNSSSKIVEIRLAM